MNTPLPLPPPSSLSSASDEARIEKLLLRCSRKASEAFHRKYEALEATHYRRTETALMLVIDPGNAKSREYGIAYDRMDTAEKALDWQRHLMGKSWISIIHLRVFLRVAIELGARTVDA